jgi:hypothetical protein
LFALASLKSVWFIILKWFGRLSILLFFLLSNTIWKALSRGGGIARKIVEWGNNLLTWLRQNYFLVTLTIIGLVIVLAAFTLLFAYKKYLKKDFY